MNNTHHISTVITYNHFRKACRDAVAGQPASQIVNIANKTVYEMNQLKSILPTAPYLPRSHDHAEQSYFCQGCGEQVQWVKTTSATFGTIKIPPKWCQDCRKKLYEAHLAEEEAKKYEESKGAFYGLLNQVQHHENETPSLFVLKAKSAQEQLIEHMTSVWTGDKQGAYVYGSTGTGKTLLTKALNNDLIDRRRDVIFVKAVRLANLLRKETFSGDSYRSFIGKLQKCDVVIIDDFGVHSHTPWVKETMFEIIDYRYENMKTTIITSNEPIESVHEIDSRLASRFKTLKWMKKIPIFTVDFRSEKIFPKLTEESFIMAIKSDPDKSHLMKNNIALMEYAKKTAPHLNMETVARYRREYENTPTPTEGRLKNSIVRFNS